MINEIQLNIKFGNNVHMPLTAREEGIGAFPPVGDCNTHLPLNIYKITKKKKKKKKKNSHFE